MSRAFKYTLITLVFLFPFVFIFLIDPDPRFLFENAKGDCSGRALFMYSAIYQKEHNPEIVYFGSSRTMNSINDVMLSDGSKSKHLNMGYCRFGRNLDYFFISEYLRNHNPKNIVIEIRELEDDIAHPLTPFLLPLKDVVIEAKRLDPSFFNHVYDKFLCNLKYLRTQLFGNDSSLNRRVNVHSGYWPRPEMANPETLLKERQTDSLKLLANNNYKMTINEGSTTYFEEIAKLCNRLKTKVYFLYLPSFGNAHKEPALKNEYIKYGKLILAPDSIWKKARNFSDYGHLNQKGADELSIWLKKQQLF